MWIRSQRRSPPSLTARTAAAYSVYELPLLTALCDTLALLASEAPVECRVILGFCRRGGALCPPEQAEAIIMQQFEHTVRATACPGVSWLYMHYM